MYEIFELLCNEKGITPYKFCKDTGVSTSTISTWKKKNSQCRPELAEKVCNYFGISHDYLMTGKEKDKREIPNFDWNTEHGLLIEMYSKINKEQKAAVFNLIRSMLSDGQI